jgi:transposase
MNKPLPTIHESPASLQKQLRAERHPKRHQQLQALYLLASGQARSRLALAELLAVHRHTIRAWLDLYGQGGLPALLTIQQAPGKASAVPAHVRTQLQARLDDPRGFASYGEIQQYLACQYHIHLSYSAVHALVRYHLHAKPKAPRHSHPKKSPKRWRSSATPCPRRCGVQPLVPAAYHFESLYLYGAVEPLTGESFFLELPVLNTQGFQLFLDHFAATDPTSFHLFLLDNGAFHKAQFLRLPRNVGLLFLPPYAPELNPIERLWRDLKDWLAQHHPTTLDALSKLLGTRLQHYTTVTLRSLTGFSYLLMAIHQVFVQLS